MNNSEFIVTVRNTEPLIKRTGKVRGGIIESVMYAIASALVLESALALFLSMAGVQNLIVYTLPAPVIFLVFSLVERKVPWKIKAIIISVLSVILIIVGIVLRKYTFNGFELIMNQLYEMGEYAQSYVYTRFTIGETGMSSPDRCMLAATLIISSLIGLLISIPGERVRVDLCAAIFIAITLAIAYFGLIPATAATALIVLAMLLLLGRGRIASVLPLMIAVGIIFFAIVAINPGENYSISRVDENLRDRIALGTVQLENDDMYSTGDDYNFNGSDSQDNVSDSSFINSETFERHKALWIGIFIMIPVIIIAVISALLHKMLERKRHDVRSGLDSTDAKTAITAMFPYSMKWLRSYGIIEESSPGTPFSEMTEAVRNKTNEAYTEKFSKMNNLWKKAAYSDHDMSAAELEEMKSFMEETIHMTKDEIKLKEKLKIRFKYAL